MCVQYIEYYTIMYYMTIYYSTKKMIGNSNYISLALVSKVPPPRESRQRGTWWAKRDTLGILQDRSMAAPPWSPPPSPPHTEAVWLIISFSSAADILPAKTPLQLTELYRMVIFCSTPMCITLEFTGTHILAQLFTCTHRIWRKLYVMHFHTCHNSYAWNQ